MTRATAVGISVFLICGWTGVAQAGADTKIPIDPTVANRGVARDGGKVGTDPGVKNAKKPAVARKPIPPQAGKNERAPKSTVKQTTTTDDIGETGRRVSR